MPERIDRVGQHKTAMKKNRQIILATQEICGICGAPVDKTLKAPDPMSPTIDHIVPVALGGHPSSLDNLQLAHRWCNMHKGDRMIAPGCEKAPGLKNTRPVKNPPVQKPGGGFNSQEEGTVGNDDLPLHADWAALKWD